MTGIAIIGIGCRFPGGVADPQSFWRLLAEGRAAIGEIPAERWSLEGFYDPAPDNPDRSYSKWGGFLDDIAAFDPDFFGLGRHQAEAMDPQQRLLLEVAYEAVDDARQTLARLRERTTGVFIGVSNNDYDRLQRFRHRTGDPQAGTGTALSIVANRISNRFDLSGPSLGVDTACSSALVAVDAAGAKLLAGDCDVALAGGVNVLLDPRMFVTFSRAHMLSATGAIRAFDAGADGFVRGEGLGVVLLKRHEEARRDGDRIYAVIEATAVNQDGATGTITAPSQAAQIAMLRRAAEKANVGPQDLVFAEAHGTGTPLGDPVEAAAIGQVFGGPGRGRPLPIGSCKTNIGHLEPAAGIAGLIKAALALHHGELPASLGFERPNPAIPFEALNIEVAAKAAPLSRTGSKAVALVNAFGFGGTNACALLRGVDRPAPARAANTASPAVAPREGPVPVPLSAATTDQLAAYAGRLAAALEEGGSLAGQPLEAIAATLATRRDPFAHRAVILADGIADLRKKLSLMAEGGEEPRGKGAGLPRVVTGRAEKGRRLAFTFTGQGGQWWAMGRDLLQRHPVFRRTVHDFDAHFKAKAGWSVVDVLMAGEAESVVGDATVTPAAMFALQAGLAAVWRAVGVTPDHLIGHSFGEVTAAYLGGALGLEDVAHLVRIRGSIRAEFDRTGAMAPIGMGAETLEPLLPRSGAIEIIALNAPNAVTVAGEAAAVDALLALIAHREPGVRTHKLALDFAWHSSWLAPGEESFKAQVGTLDWRAPHTSVISTVTGEPQTRFDTDYWWANLRRPVRYRDAVSRALAEGADTFLELGPQRTLSSLTRECALAEGREVATVSTLERGENDFVSLAHATARLWTAGLEIDWRALLGPANDGVELPRLPWMNRRLWLEPEEAQHALTPSDWHPLLGVRDPGPVPQWSGELGLSSHPFLADHRVAGGALFPVAGYIEMMRAAGEQLFGPSGLELSDLRFEHALPLEPGDSVQLKTVFDEARRRIAINWRNREGGEWTRAAEARLLAREVRLEGTLEPPVHWTLDAEAFYLGARAAGYDYGPAFRSLAGIARHGNHAVGEARLPEGAPPAAMGLDPCLLDACLQLGLAAINQEDDDDAPALPVAIGRVLIAGPLEDPALARATAGSADDGETRLDLLIATQGGAPRLRIEGLRLRPLTGGTPAGEGARQGAFLEEIFVPFEAEGVAEARRDDGGRWLLLARPGGTAGDALAAALAARGCEPVVIALAQDEAVDAGACARAIAAASAQDPLAGVIYAIPADAPEIEAEAGLYVALEREVRCLTRFGQALALLQAGSQPGALWVLTRNARAADPDETGDLSGLAQSALPGLARTIALETRAARFHLADLDSGALDRPGALADLIASGTGETELLVRGQTVLVPRLRRRLVRELPAAHRPLAALGPAQDFALRRRGAAELEWREAEPREPGPGEVRVEVLAAGLNFRDVMAAAGLLPQGAEPGDPGAALGLECAGRVTAVGADVEGLAPGGRVIALARGALRRFVTLPAHRVFAAPPALSMAEAAGLPSVYLTAHYALDRIARLQAGERVLIHNASGGVGLAAVALARRVGAEIIATAGTGEKRAHLAALGIAHLFDSRDLGFADHVMEATGGSGVDVVLNALAGPFIDKGLRCLAPYGRFVELGKRDVYAGGALGLEALKQNLSFHVVDVASLIEDRPREVRALMEEVLAMIAAGEIGALPTTLFPGAEVEAAFRRFSDADHAGKIAVALDDPSIPVHADLGLGRRLDPEGAYLVTGGTSGFGFAAARHLAEGGAGRLVLASRTGRPAASLVGEVARLGRRVELIKLDLADEPAVTLAVARLAQADMPLRGIVHAAAHYDDAPLAQMDDERIASVLAPKVAGALALTRAVLAAGATLDFFVSFSSLAQTLGWAGQANYAAANAFLEGLARYQRARGIPGRCLSWSVLGQSGVVARNADMARYLETSGWRALDDAEALRAFGEALCLEAPALGYAAVDWDRLAATHPSLAAAPRMGGLLAADGQGDARTGAFSAEPVRRLAQARVVAAAQLAKVLRIGEEELARYQTLDDAGLDSLTTFELHGRLESATGLAIPLGRMTQACATIGDLAEMISSLAAPPGAEESDADARADAPPRTDPPAARTAAE